VYDRPGSMVRVKTVLFVLLAVLVGGADAVPLRGAAESRGLAVLQSELQRNYDALKKEATPAYFLSYTVHDTRSTRIAASYGALDQSDDARSRFASVEVRVGDYTLDNTHPIRGDSRANSPRLNQVALPLAEGADTDQAVRLALWRVTDRTYKQATEAYTRVKANVAGKVREENPAPDFTHEDAQTYIGEPVAYTVDAKEWQARLRRLSAPFASDPLIFRSSVTLTIDADNRTYVNTEGSRVADGSLACRLFVDAVTKASDGMELPLYLSYFSTTVAGLPDEKQVLSDIRKMIDLLGQLRKAPLVQPYSGPAILSGRAAGVFFHEIFGHRVEADRQRNADDGQTFGSRIGEPVLPSFLSVTFDPTLARIGGTELMGHYQYDDQGVKGRRVTVVDHGTLRTFLLDRAPLGQFSRSNGHGRAEPGYVPVSRQSNLVVESSKTVSNERLMGMLREEARKQGKPFGLLFDNIEGGVTNTDRRSASAFNVFPNVVYRVYADETREPELVRGVDLVGTPLASFAKIVATGDKVDVFNGVCGAESGGVPVSASAPALLVSEVEVQKKAQSLEPLPILAAPRKR